MSYITHARSAEELRAELLSDLRRRIEGLERQCETFAKGAAGKARFAGRINELETMLKFWTEVQIAASAKRTITN